MGQELQFKGTVRCIWVKPNNGIIKAHYEPDPGIPGLEYFLFNLRSERGLPTLWRPYWIEIQPAFPHDAERNEN